MSRQICCERNRQGLGLGSIPAWSSSQHFSNYYLPFHYFKGVVFLFPYFPSFNVLKLKIKIAITPAVAIPIASEVGFDYIPHMHSEIVVSIRLLISVLKSAIQWLVLTCRLRSHLLYQMLFGIAHRDKNENLRELYSLLCVYGSEAKGFIGYYYL